MGGVLSLGSMACCLTGTCVSTTCAICPSSCGNSGLAKFMYALVLLVTVVISCIMLAPGVETWLNKSPFCEQINPGQHSSVHQGKDLGQQFTDFGKQLVGQASNIVVPKLPCADAIGYLAVYRICFVVAGKTFKSLLKRSFLDMIIVLIQLFVTVFFLLTAFAIYYLLTIFYTVKYIFLKSKTKKVGKLLGD